MNRKRLNLQALRARRLPAAPSPTSPEELLENESFTLNRREMLGVMGLAGVSPLLKPVGSTLLGSFRVDTSPNRVAFWMRGKERWVVDAKRFEGRTKVSVKKVDKAIRVRLRGGRFPGTRLPADFDAELTPGLTGWRIQLTTAYGLTSDAPFEAWLMGRRSVVGRVAIDTTVGRSIVHPMFRLKGSARASFTPDWTIRFSAPSVGTVAAGSIRVRGDHATVGLLSPDHDSLFASPPSKRTLVTLDRGSRDWQITPRIHTGALWQFKAAPNAFDRIVVESAASGLGRHSFAACAECLDSRKHRVSVVPAGCCARPDGGPFEIPLSDPRYAISLNNGGVHAAVASGFIQGVSWLRAQNFSVEVGKYSDDGATFCISAADRKLESVDCTLDVYQTILQPDGDSVIAQPAALSEPRPIRFAWGRRRSPRDSAPALDEIFLRQTSSGLHAELKLAVAPVELIRPEDFAALRFEFRNMNVETRSGQRYVVPSGEGTAYLVAQLQTQNIAEEALFETAEGYEVSEAADAAADDGPVADSLEKDKTTSGSDKPSDFPPPVQARMGGPSRIVFRVPNNTSIPFTLEGLLQACTELDMSLAGNALPPDRARIFILDDSLGNALDSNSLSIDPGALKKSGVSLWSTLQASQSQAQATRRVGRGQRISQVRLQPRRAPVSISMSDDVESTAPSKTTELIRTYRNRLLSKQSSVGRIISVDERQRAVTDRITPELGGRLVVIPRPTAPGALTTAIEAPYRLYMSPNRYGAWAHSAEPVASPDGIYELWHSRLGIRDADGGVFEGSHWAKTMRAIWSPDYVADALSGPAASNNPFRMSLDGSDRHNLVHLTSDFSHSPYRPRPVTVRDFMISSLGAWINWRGDFGPNADDLPDGLAVLEWVHRSTMARDHYVKVVYAGYLFPWGHQASLIKITERKFAKHPTQAGAKIAYLFQRMFIVVREPLKVIRTGNAALDRQNPFKSAQILTLNTPNIDKPEATDYPEPNGRLQEIFWPQVGGADFLFNMRLEDIEGGLHEVTMPLAFVRKDQVDKWENDHPESAVEDLVNDYNDGTGSMKQARRTRAFNGQTVAYADSTVPGDTSFETDTVTFGAEMITSRPGFAPVLRLATAVVPAVKQLAQDETPIPVKYYDRYLNAAFASSGPNKNTGEIFLSIITDTSDEAVTPETENAVQDYDVNFSSQGDRSGGLVQPNLRVQGLSRKKGPVSGRGKEALDTFANGQFEAEKYFGAPDAQGQAADPNNPPLPEGLLPKLFGVINLWDIIEATGIDGAGAPKFITETLGVVEDFLAAVAAFRNLIQSGLNGVAAIQADVQAIQQDFNNIENDLDALTGDNFPGQLPNHLNDLLQHVQSLLGDIPNVDGIDSGLRHQAQRTLTQFETWLADSGFIDAARAFVMALEAVQQKTIRLEWRPPLRPFGLPNAPPIFDTKNLNGTPASLTLGVEMKAEGGGPGSQPALDVYCALENFTLDLIPVPGGTAANLFTRILKLGFDRVSFFAGSATKPGVDVVLSGLEFQGVLSFVETLRDLIPLDGFSDPPYIDVSASGIVAGFDLDIPGVSVGVFSLQNISLGAELKIPFIGESLEVGFNFNRKENPCLLSVWIFGGGAYFGVTITPRGLRAIRAAFEFGATASLNFGVASGGVYVFAGIYFEYVVAQVEGEEDSITLLGYLRLGGHVSVLGLISISIELRMEIGYENGKATGRATLQVEVEILFFSKTVSISYEKKFKGANGDPTFLQMMGDPYLEPVSNQMVEPWPLYARAFA